MSTEKRYRIVKLSASNVKRLTAVEILPTGNVISIGGKNDQGKTSVLDAITYACAGAGSICEQPIRHGASKAEIVVDLGDMVITKTFTAAAAPKLKVNMKDGSPVSSPQAILDALASKISYDPMMWMRMKPAEQLEMLRKLVGIDFAPLDQSLAKHYNDRTNVNRSLDHKKAKLATMTQHPDAPAEEVSVKALMEQLTALRKSNQTNAQERSKLHNARMALNDATDAVTNTKKAIAELQSQLEKDLAEVTKCQSNVTALLPADELKDQDEYPISKQIEDADGINSKVRDNATRKTLTDEVNGLQQESDAHTAAIEQVDTDKQEMLSKAKFPLPGLSFDDSGVLLDGVPFSQAGMAKKIRASVAIGLALNPKLRVILIRDGSLLDEDSMKSLAEIAEREDAQVWIEVVSDKNVSVVIEDGMVREA